MSEGSSTMGPSQAVSEHLVFFIHGMGQQYEENGHIDHHVSTIQANTTEILDSLFPDHRVRVKYIVIEWHSILHKFVDSKIDQATMFNVPKVRMAMNHWLMDCMYYFTKPHGQCIIDTICEQCNKQYQLHLEGAPDFDGQVHMIGFSLGGVAAYDILSMQWDEDQENGSPPPPWHHIEEKDYTCRKPEVHVPLLDFRVSCLFTCGSPIAAALVFRGLDFKYYHPPPHTRIYNIFHPFDPFGYRIEPMINDDYMAIHPVRVDRAPRKPILKIPDLGIKKSIAPLIMRAQRSWESISSKSATTSSPAAAAAAESDTSSEGGERGLVDAHTIVFETSKAVVDDQTSSSTSTKEDLALEDEEIILGKNGAHYPRMDYMLHENVIDAYASEWIIAAKSHFRYWANRDVALHIVKSILQEN